MDDVRITDNEASTTYELWVGDELAGTIRYRASEETVALIHTEISPDFEGRGLGSKLVAGALDDIRDRGLRVIPICRFVRSYLERHPEHADLVAPTRVR
jgi:uncharacterized protein